MSGALSEGPVRALGLMSGTSLDGVDAALIETDGVTVSGFGPWRTAPYSDDLRERLRAVIEGRGEREDAERALTEFHADAAEALLAEAGVRREEIAVAGFHGHTIRHEPEAGLTDQIGDGAALARQLGIGVVNDFRSSDVAAGGQGAPLVPLFHAALARRSGLAAPLAVLNLGGVANVTWIGGPADEDLLAFDTGPGCALIDDWVLSRTGAALDRDGRLARSGTVDRAALKALLAHPYFDAEPPKSLDRNAFDPAAGQRTDGGQWRRDLGGLHCGSRAPRARAHAGGAFALAGDRRRAAQPGAHGGARGARGRALRCGGARRLAGRCAGGAGLRLPRRALPARACAQPCRAPRASPTR